jgi:Fe-S cluster biogenesis protein NfuA
MSALVNNEFQARSGRVERMVERATGLNDPEARATALELLQSVMDLHGAVVSRIVELLKATEAGRASLAKLGADPLICGMLVLYGVHPVPLEERVARAVNDAAPQLRKHSGSAELIAVDETLVRVKVQSSGHGCGSSADALKSTVEQAILEAAPEVAEIVVEGATNSATSGFVPLNLVQPAVKEEKDYEESAA